MGPGVITGASDDDPSGILTYLQAGVILGLRALWTVMITFPLMCAIQEMCGRIGFVTKKGLMRIIKERYPKSILYSIAFVSIIVITINIGADLMAVGVISERLIGLNRIFWIPAAAFIILICMIFFSYRRFAQIMKYLTISLFFYILTVFLIKMDWFAAIKATLIPRMSFTKETFILIAAILGTTISPYLFFWQTSEEVEEREILEENNHKKSDSPLNQTQYPSATKKQIRTLEKDTFTGMLFSNVVMWFIIAGASQLGRLYGIKEITSFDQASTILEPLLGKFAYVMFSLGIIGTGFLAIPVLAGSVGYAFSEIFGWEEGVNKSFRQAKGFYIVIVGATIGGMLITLLGIDPIKLLIYTAVLYSIISPPLIYLVLKIANDKNIMGENVNGKISNFFSCAALIIITLSIIAYFLSVI